MTVLVPKILTEGIAATLNTLREEVMNAKQLAAMYTSKWNFDLLKLLEMRLTTVSNKTVVKPLQTRFTSRYISL